MIQEALIIGCAIIAGACIIADGGTPRTRGGYQPQSRPLAPPPRTPSGQEFPPRPTRPSR